MMSNNISMMTSTKYFWFLLLDAATGQPYKGTTADFVSLSPGAVVAEFRDAVLSKNSNKLAGVDASDLLIYKNKAAFDTRNLTAVDEGKEEPLKASSNLDGLGETEEGALIVVVPSLLLLSSSSIQPSQQQIHQPTSFPPCQVQFFNSICNATEIDGGPWLSFGNNIMPDTSLTRLYIRKSYRTIASSILEVKYKAIVTGTPGIGKSLFLIYLLWNLVKRGKRVLFIYHPFNIYYDEEGGVFRFASSRLPLDDDDSFWNETLWCLFDAKGKNEANLYEFPTSLCKFILSTSPRREMVNDFKKPPVPDCFYMPIWTEAELEAIAPLFPNSSDEWHNRFTILGGIPRHVLEVTRHTPTEILKAACSVCTLDDCIQAVGIEFELTPKSKTVHSLIHVDSDHPYTKSSVRYASPTALNMIVHHWGAQARGKMRALLSACNRNPLTAALCGYVFEQYAIELLEKGGKFHCRQLFHGNKKIKPNDGTLDILPSTKIVAERVLSSHTLHQLYVPKAKNYAAIDAWIPGVGAFQITVGKNHELNRRVEEDLAELGEAKRLYWVLPPEHYHSFTKKTPQSIEQYAVMIPLPE
jgi:hypothetical protein